VVAYFNCTANLQSALAICEHFGGLGIHPELDPNLISRSDGVCDMAVGRYWQRWRNWTSSWQFSGSCGGPGLCGSGRITSIWPYSGYRVAAFPGRIATMKTMPMNA
jgi:hypothetical protein